MTVSRARPDRGERPEGPDPARGIARTVLYEGYVLWPYRRSAPKNQRRWTFGGVHPRSWSEDGHPDDPWRLHTECLAELPSDGDAEPTVRVGLRFLQIVERRVARFEDGALEFADRIEAGGERWTAWDEAREREFWSPPLALRPGDRVRVPLDLHAASERAWLEDDAGRKEGAVVRSWRSLSGELVARCEAVGDGACRVSVSVSNATPWQGEEREDALRSCFASAHVVLRADGADLVSLTDPPDALEDAADGCRNDGWWPVLVGERGARDTILSSPIILPDYPAIAPESPGDLFDGGEIDELLTLHIMALTDEEKEEMRATDPKTREILERTTALDPDDLLEMHGTFRGGPHGDPAPGGDGLADEAPDAFWREMGRTGDQEIVVDGVTLRRGSRVRLCPNPGGDVMDLALDGRVGIVEGIDEDDAGGVHFTVVVEGDPGLDLGMAKMPGHRFFFRPDEIEPIEEGR